MLLEIGDRGPDVISLQGALFRKGFEPGLIDGDFGPGTEAAVMALQRGEGLEPDGVYGPLTAAALVAAPQVAIPSRELFSSPVVASEKFRNIVTVSRMLPGAHLANIKLYLPPILAALDEFAMSDDTMFLMAISSVGTEEAGFEPTSEGRSRYNTSPRGHLFDLYDNRRDLGNNGAPDGALYRGRGFGQITGLDNYTRMDRELELDGALLQNPELANDPIVAARVLGRFLKDHERPIRTALANNQLTNARRLYNGGVHGLDVFTQAYNTGLKIRRMLPA